MKLTTQIIFFLGLFLTGALQASTKNMTKIEDLKIIENGDNKEVGTLIAKISGGFSETPEVEVRDKMIQLSVKNAYVWPKIEKKASLQSKFDTTLMAYQFNKEVVRLRAMLPYSLKGKEDRISVTLRDGNIELAFPKQQVGRSQSIVDTSVDRKKYDESYLEKLLNDSDSNAKTDYASDFEEAQEKAGSREKKKDKDEVSLAMSAQERGGESASSSFSLGSYIGKFVAFMALVLLLFYGMVTLMKKGVFKKSRLGFLNSTKIVEVLNTTYLGPKRSLLMVKAHNQVFLLGSSETGINLISEVNDVAGLLKDGEKKIAGDNFDTSLDEANQTTKEFSLKELESATQENQLTKAQSNSNGLDKLLSSKSEHKDTVKFSDQIKDKVKNLKSLQ